MKISLLLPRKTSIYLLTIKEVGKKGGGESKSLLHYNHEDRGKKKMEEI